MDCLTQEQIEALAGNTAGPAEATAWRRHIGQCATCRGRLAELRRSDVVDVTTDLSAPNATGSSATRVSPGAGAATSFGPPAGSFAGYQVVKEIHRGGQGVVYQALQISTKRRVALKVMKEGPFASVAEKARFEREIEILGQLNHPNIVAIHDSGEAAGHFYYAMDYISGQSLDEWSASTPRSIEDTLRLFAKICAAINAAHLKGVIHRDLKPGNIRVDTEGEPHILDFGLAKVAHGSEKALLMTMTGQFMGSLPWASPEQAAAQPGQIDIRTDVYSLGVILYQMLTGRFPYEVVGNMRDVLDRIMKAEPARPSTIRRRIGHEVETITLKCLSKERERRYQSAGAIADDIHRYLAGQPIQARRDSVTYIAWAHARRLLRRHPVTITLSGLVLIALLTQYLAVPVVYRWTMLNDYYEAGLSALPAVRKSPDFERVRVLALTDQTDIGSLAQAAALPDVSAEDRPSLRRLHGALMERLAASGLRALVWDIRFGAASEFDDDLVRGIQAVQARGADVIVSAADWKLDKAGLPLVSPTILPYVKWGAATADFSAARPWSLDLLVVRRGSEPTPSLDLLAVASYRHPGAEALLLMNPAHQAVGLHYWKPASAVPRAKLWLEDGDSLRLTGLWALPNDDEAHGLLRADVVGHYFITIPPDDVLRRGTLEYQDVFTATEPQLRTWLADRVVIVGDLRGDTDRHPYVDGRRVPGPYGHAAAIEALLLRFAIRSPTYAQTWLIVGLVVLAGAAAGLLLHRSIAHCALLLALLTAVAVAASVEGYREAQYLVNPLVPVFGLLASGTCVAFACRRVRTGRTGTEAWEASA